MINSCNFLKYQSVKATDKVEGIHEIIDFWPF